MKHRLRLQQRRVAREAGTQRKQNQAALVHRRATSVGGHWITSSARSNNACGIVSPNAMAVLRFTDSV